MKTKRTKLKVNPDTWIFDTNDEFYKDLANFHNSKKAEKFDKERTKTNQKLVDILQKLVDENPSMRFSQILRNYNFVEEVELSDGDIYWYSEFYIEPKVILKRVKNVVKNTKI